MNHWKNIARWIVLLPAAILAAFAGLIVTRLFLLFLQFIASLNLPRIASSDGLMNTIFLEIVPAISFGVCFIKSGVFVAPAYKKATSLVLFLLLLAFMILGLISTALYATPDWTRYLAASGIFLGSGTATLLTLKPQLITSEQGTQPLKEPYTSPPPAGTQEQADLLRRAQKAAKPTTKP